PEAYANMQEKQEENEIADNGGLDANGNPVDTEGEPMTYEGINGPEEVSMDDEGYLTDANGERLDADEVSGASSNNFEAVTDPETGETHLQHKGEDAFGKDASLGVDHEAESEDLQKASQTLSEATREREKSEQRLAELQAN